MVEGTGLKQDGKVQKKEKEDDVVEEEQAKENINRKRMPTKHNWRKSNDLR